MKVVPEDIVGKIEFAEDHLALWAANAVAMGSSADEITAVTTKTNAARLAYEAAKVARLAAKNATIDQNTALDVLNDAMSDLIKKVRAKAATDGDGIYALAGIPVPAIPGPVGPPGTPEQFKVTLNPDGSLKLKWACINPRGAVGTTYQVGRRIGTSGDFVSIGVAGVKSFTDISVPAGAPGVTYSIRAVRSTALGVTAFFTVNFGVSGGTLTASIAPRMAA